MKSISMSRAMTPKMTRVVVCAIFLLVCTTVAVLRNAFEIDFDDTDDDVQLDPSEDEAATNIQKLTPLQVLVPAQFDNQSDVKCVKAAIGNLSFPMCVYNAQDDIRISKVVIAGQYFESDLVQKLLNFFRKYHDVSFVDLGANLGTYSLPIAHSGIHVVSVEPNKDTVRRLAKSVHLGRIEKNIDIFHYALSNEESTTFLKFNSWNRGDTYMASEGSCPGCLTVKVTVLNKLIPFIKHKKAFIKIDTQEAEIMIFKRKSAAKFFDEIDVVMIQMEWAFYPSRHGYSEDGRRSVDRFLEFFYQRGYNVYDPRTEKKLGANWRKWTNDVLFKKEDLPRNQLFAI